MFIVIALMAICECTTQEISRNIHERARAHEASMRGTPREQSRAPMPSYDQYERERPVGR
jgi:hypothetical protein